MLIIFDFESDFSTTTNKWASQSVGVIRSCFKFDLQPNQPSQMSDEVVKMNARDKPMDIEETEVRNKIEHFFFENFPGFLFLENRENSGFIHEFEEKEQTPIYLLLFWIFRDYFPNFSIFQDFKKYRTFWRLSRLTKNVFHRKRSLI